MQSYSVNMAIVEAGITGRSVNDSRSTAKPAQESIIESLNGRSTEVPAVPRRANSSFRAESERVLLKKLSELARRSGRLINKIRS